MSVSRESLDVLLGEIKSFRDYLFHLENQMFSLLKLYASFFTFIISSAIALFYYFYVEHPHKISLIYLVMVLFSIIFFILGFYQLVMFLEMRIRKIKVIEQIANIGQQFNIYDEYRDSNIMISSIAESPKYLRRPCSEWFSVLYFSTVNSLLYAAFVYFVNRLYLISNDPVLYVSPYVYLPINFILLFCLQYCWATIYCFYYDKKREIYYELHRKYSLLARGVPIILKPFDLIAGLTERVFATQIEKMILEEKGEKEYIKRKRDGCLFCTPSGTILFKNAHFMVRYDDYPVSKGHTLVIPLAHHESLSELDVSELMALRSIILKTLSYIEKEFSCTGFNIGVNLGEDAGQTQSHIHFHIIPRYPGDVEHPEGGVRNILPNEFRV